MNDALYELSRSYITTKYEPYQRYFIRNNPLKHRFAIILGERGIGKTTTLIQYLLLATDHKQHSETILYVPVDHFLVRRSTLYEITETFYKLGGKTIAFDEIHKYPDWSMELKSIYDTFPDLRILASGSSTLEIHKGSHDLSRRALVYKMVGLSFREFIEIKYGLTLPVYSLSDIMQHHTELAITLLATLSPYKFKILKLFKEYLEMGYYPYFREFELFDEFKITLEQNLHTTLESDLVATYPHLTGHSIKKIKQLVTYIAQEVPFTPNWQKIRGITDIGDDRTLKTYFKYLEDADIISMLGSNSHKMKQLESPEKIFLANTNQLYAFSAIHPNIGTVRETFFLRMLKPLHDITTNKVSDFVVNDKFYFEIGGKNKDQKQLKDHTNAYLVLDDIEHGTNRRIPLWLFGFLY
jgi:predicted AAA+ superfamily ATPase